MKRTDPVVPHLFFHVLAFAAAFGLLSTAATGQLQRAAKAETLRRVVTGRVVMPDGSPAAGAVVVTNAGGQTVSGPDGTFALELELPRDADSLELTAIAEAGRAGSGLVANLSLAPSSFSPSISVGSLALALSPRSTSAAASAGGSSAGTAPPGRRSGRASTTPFSRSRPGTTAAVPRSTRAASSSRARRATAEPVLGERSLP